MQPGPPSSMAPGSKVASQGSNAGLSGVLRPSLRGHIVSLLPDSVGHCGHRCLPSLKGWERGSCPSAGTGSGPGCQESRWSRHWWARPESCKHDISKAPRSGRLGTRAGELATALPRQLVQGCDGHHSLPPATLDRSPSPLQLCGLLLWSELGLLPSAV